MQPPRKLNLIELICGSVAILWKEWPKDMELSKVEHGGFVLKGKCPYCGNQAAFPTVTDPYREGSGNEQRLIAVARCIACEEYILALLRIEERFGWIYDCHYPLDKPNDTLSEDIPLEIRSDFKEAMRAEWIKAYKATVLMCRRSLQTSCDMEKALGNDLYNQIDDLGRL